MAERIKTKPQQTEYKTSSSQSHHTTNEMRIWYEKHKNTIENFAKVQEALRLHDPGKSTSRIYSTFNKDTLRTYMKNPAANQSNLRQLSRFLYYRSNPYRRLITYNATALNLDARSVIPTYNINKENDVKKTLKQYHDTLSTLDNMNLNLELLKLYIINWREDTSFGCAYYDDEGLFILPLDGDYCQITCAYPNGSFGFSMNMSYFATRASELEFYGEPFISMYSAYQKDMVNGKWQEMPEEYAVCFKINIDDITLPLPPYLALFNSIISLTDLEEIQSVKNEMDIYKLLVARFETIQGSNTPDDFTVDPDTAISYFDRMSEYLPDYVAAILSPIPIDSIEFNKNQTSDVNQIESATESLFNTSGGAQILNSSSISGSTAFTAAIMADSKQAISSLLPQTQQWLNRFLTYHIKNPAKVKFLPVTEYTKAEYRKSLLESGTYGLPTRLALNSLNSFSELDTLSLKFLEQDCLNLDKELIPMMSSHTQASGNDSSTGGAPEKDLDEISDDGDKSKDKRDKAK